MATLPNSASDPNVVWEHFDKTHEAYAGAAASVLANGLEAGMVKQIESLVPDRAIWRLRITGDVVTTVHEVESRTEKNPYTMTRGAGVVGGCTIPNKDGTYDMIVGVESMVIAREDFDDVDQAIEHMVAEGMHLALHEAGHVHLSLNGEDAKSIEPMKPLGTAEEQWRQVLGSHVDDFRIERMTMSIFPSQNSQVPNLDSAIDHVRNTLNRTRRTMKVDFEPAAVDALRAANSLVRVFAYLSAELGLNDDESAANRPRPKPDAWDLYADGFWDEWALTFHRLHPADERMTQAEIDGVIEDLMSLTFRWLDSIGLHMENAVGGGFGLYWTRLLY